MLEGLTKKLNLNTPRFMLVSGREEPFPYSIQDEQYCNPDDSVLLRQRSWTSSLSNIALIISIILNLLLAFHTLLAEKALYPRCARQTSVWSPLLSNVEYEEVQIPNEYNQSTIYRGTPTAELEQAWDQLWLYGSVEIPADKLSLLGKTEDDALHFGTTRNGGYRAMIDGFHQLHCLNFIRQYTYLDYYQRHSDMLTIPDIFKNAFDARTHVDHCIEALRISLICHGDVTPYFMIEDDEAPNGLRADFSPLRKCRKFDMLQEYMRGHTVG